MLRRPPRSSLFPYTTLFRSGLALRRDLAHEQVARADLGADAHDAAVVEVAQRLDRKSTRLNSSHANISYAVFCLKKKKKSCSSRRTLSHTSGCMLSVYA